MIKTKKWIKKNEFNPIPKTPPKTFKELSKYDRTYCNYLTRVHINVVEYGPKMKHIIDSCTVEKPYSNFTYVKMDEVFDLITYFKDKRFAIIADMICYVCRWDPDETTISKYHSYVKFLGEICFDINNRYYIESYPTRTLESDFNKILAHCNIDELLDPDEYLGYKFFKQYFDYNEKSIFSQFFNRQIEKINRLKNIFKTDNLNDFIQTCNSGDEFLHKDYIDIYITKYDCVKIVRYLVTKNYFTKDKRYKIPDNIEIYRLLENICKFILCAEDKTYINIRNKKTYLYHISKYCTEKEIEFCLNHLKFPLDSVLEFGIKIEPVITDKIETDVEQKRMEEIYEMHSCKLLKDLLISMIIDHNYE